MDIISGKFDNQITLYTQNVSKSSTSGATSLTYTEGETLWCYINNRANNEQFIESKRDVSDRITLDVRYNDAIDVTNQYQFDYEGQMYAVVTKFEAPEYGRRNVFRIVGEVLV